MSRFLWIVEIELSIFVLYKKTYTLYFYIFGVYLNWTDKDMKLIFHIQGFSLQYESENFKVLTVYFLGRKIYKFFFFIFLTLAAVTISLHDFLIYINRLFLMKMTNEMINR